MARLIEELTLTELLVKFESADEKLKRRIKAEIEKRQPSMEDYKKSAEEFEEVRKRANESLSLFVKIRCILIPAFDAFQKVEEDVLIDWEYAGYDRKVKEYHKYALAGGLLYFLIGLGLAAYWLFDLAKYF